MLDKVKKRLKELGYRVKEEDMFSLAFCVEKVRNSIQNKINCSGIPNGLEHIAIDMSVGEFLLAKKTFSPADLAGFNLEYAVKQIQAGDTNTQFYNEGSMTDEQRLNALVTHLLSYGKDEFPAYRRLRW